MNEINAPMHVHESQSDPRQGKLMKWKFDTFIRKGLCNWFFLFPSSILYTSCPWWRSLEMVRL